MVVPEFQRPWLPRWESSVYARRPHTAAQVTAGAGLNVAVGGPVALPSEQMSMAALASTVSLGAPSVVTLVNLTSKRPPKPKSCPYPPRRCRGSRAARGERLSELPVRRQDRDETEAHRSRVDVGLALRCRRRYARESDRGDNHPNPREATAPTLHGTHSFSKRSASLHRRGAPHVAPGRSRCREPTPSTRTRSRTWPGALSNWHVAPGQPRALHAAFARSEVTQPVTELLGSSLRVQLAPLATR